MDITLTTANKRIMQDVEDINNIIKELAIEILKTDNPTEYTALIASSLLAFGNTIKNIQQMYKQHYMLLRQEAIQNKEKLPDYDQTIPILISDIIDEFISNKDLNKYFIKLLLPPKK